MLYWHKDAFDAFVKQLEENVQPQAFWKMSTQEHHFQWMSETFERYKSYIVQEADRTGRAPISHLKNFKALLSEQGQNSPAQAVQDDIDNLSL